MSLGRELTEADRGKRFVTSGGEKKVFCGFHPLRQKEGFCAIFAGEAGGLTYRKICGGFSDDGEPDLWNIVSEYIEPPKPVTVEAWGVVRLDGSVCGAFTDKPRADMYALRAHFDKPYVVRLTGTYTPGEGL